VTEHPNVALIHRFYDAFARRDTDAMAACYAPDATFRDPAFGELDAARTVAMWRMLVGRATDLEVAHTGAEADEGHGRAHWDARYTFTQTGRRVVNSIDATFRFRDGLIVRHEDRFPFWHWARQALGPAGWLLGWTPLVRARVRRTAVRSLDRWMAASGADVAVPRERAQ
jgi:ketosteroid isomerase-like protein